MKTTDDSEKKLIMLIYLDWNIINKIEKKNDLSKEEFKVYDSIEKFVELEGVFAPYSNAHIHDLLRGFKKNSDYIDGHLGKIKDVTKNLCICQYWGKTETVFHNRDVEEFFRSAIEEKEFEADSFEA